MLMSWNLFHKDMKKLNDLVRKLYVKKRVYSNLSTVNNLEKKIPDVSALV